MDAITTEMAVWGLILVIASLGLSFGAMAFRRSFNNRSDNDLY